MKILAVDSSSLTACAALTDNEKIVSQFFMNAGLTHSETLAPMIDAVLKNSKTLPQSIDLFAVSNGPGSFTGLRIGLSAVKAMALALDKPCAGVSSLEALAQNFLSFKGVVCACMDARRGTLYNALFKSNGKEIFRITPDRAISFENLAEELQNYKCGIQLVGDGADMCYNSMANNYNFENIFAPSEENKYIKASNIAFVAQKMYNPESGGKFNDVGINYIRIPQAERLLNENKLKTQVKNL